MKKLIACAILVMFICSCAFADTLDEIREDLINVINDARLLLTRFYPPVAYGSVLYDDGNVKMTAISQPYFEEGWSSGDDYGTIYIDVVIENYLDTNILCIFPEIAVNGWTMEGYGDDVMAKKRVKTSLMIGYIAETDINEAEDIETIEGIFAYVHPDSWITIGEGEFYWMFNLNTNMYEEENEYASS